MLFLWEWDDCQPNKQKLDSEIAKLGPSCNFSLTENLASVSSHDGAQSGIIISQIHLASHPAAYFEINVNIS